MVRYFIISAIGLAFAFSLISFRLNASRHLKLFSLLLGATFIVEWFAIFGVRIFHFGTNVPLYNCFMLIEFWLYGLYYKSVIDTPWVKKTIVGYLIAYPLCWLGTTLFIFGLHKWNSYICLTGSFFTISFSALYFYQVFTSERLVSLTRHTEFWIATAMILFYSMNLPYLGILSYLVKHHLSLALSLLSFLEISSIAMYTIFSFAYLCQIRR